MRRIAGALSAAAILAAPVSVSEVPGHSTKVDTSYDVFAPGPKHTVCEFGKLVLASGTTCLTEASPDEHRHLKDFYTIENSVSFAREIEVAKNAVAANGEHTYVTGENGEQILAASTLFLDVPGAVASAIQVDYTEGPLSPPVITFSTRQGDTISSAIFDTTGPYGKHIAESGRGGFIEGNGRTPGVFTQDRDDLEYLELVIATFSKKDTVDRMATVIGGLMVAVQKGAFIDEPAAVENSAQPSIAASPPVESPPTPTPDGNEVVPSWRHRVL